MKSGKNGKIIDEEIPLLLRETGFHIEYEFEESN